MVIKIVLLFASEIAEFHKKLNYLWRRGLSLSVQRLFPYYNVDYVSKDLAHIKIIIQACAYLFIIFHVTEI